MLEATRKAARRLAIWYLQRHDVPNLFMQSMKIPTAAQAFLGGGAAPMTQAFVLGTFECITFVRASCLDDAKGPVPFLPWVVPGGISSAPRDIARVIDSVSDSEPNIELGYGDGAGKELLNVGRVLVSRKLRWPVLEIACATRPGHLADGDRALQHEIPTEGLHDLAGLFAVGAMRVAADSIYLRTLVTGALVRGHEGIIEFRGEHVPVVLREKGSNIVSIVQPAPPPRRAETMTEEEQMDQRRLPGFDAPPAEDDEGGEAE
jgi:hypothetical protein